MRHTHCDTSIRPYFLHHVAAALDRLLHLHERAHVDLAGGWKCHNGYVSREPNDIRDDDKAVRAAYFRMVCQHRAERKSAVLTHFDEPKLRRTGKARDLRLDSI